MNVKPTFVRKNHIIRNARSEVVFTGETQRSPSINAAKRESRRLQVLNGKGCVRVDS